MQAVTYEAQYIIPPEYHVFERNEKYLLFDPVNFIWFITDKLGKIAFDGLAKNGNIQDAINNLINTIDIPTDSNTIPNYVEKYTKYLIDIGFIHENSYKKISWPSAVLKYPKILYIHLTNKCNLRCPYCYNQEHRFQLIQLGHKQENYKQTIETSTTDDFLKLIDEAANLGFAEVKLTGGEALLNKDALVIAERAKSKNMIVNLLTNATLIEEDIARDIAKFVDYVSISLDSPNAEEHDAVRGKGTHSKVIKAIKMLKDAGVKHIHLNSVVTPVNLNSVEAFLDYAWNSLEANEVTLAGSGINVSDPSNRWGAASYILNGEQYGHVYEQEKRFYQMRRSSQKVQQVISNVSLRRTQCGVGNGIISVESNGDVYPCQTMHSPEFLCGNVFKTGLQSIIENSSVINEMKNLQVDILPECNTCPMRYICSGGCRQEAYSRESDILARNRMMCEIYFQQSLDKLWNSATIPAQKLREAQESSRNLHAACH